jgi:predicted RNase H-like nuclease (RuvC/YqgF family)
MKNYLKNYVSPLLFLLVLLSCNNQSQKEKVEQPANPEVNEQTSEIENKSQIVAKADSVRSEIEKLVETIQPIELSTEGLRAQISQKWSKIHYYILDGKVIRIKSYPHDNISKRTEEFYFDKGNLILVCIEDNGTGERGKEKSVIDKMYYFNNDVFVEEKHNTNEPENQIRNSDSEKLLQEAKEYLEILNKK